MPIYDLDPTGTVVTRVKDVYDVTNAGVATRLKFGYDVNQAGTSLNRVYAAEAAVTLTNYGLDPGYYKSWSDTGTSSGSYKAYSGTPPIGRYWLYCYFGGWSYGYSTNGLSIAASGVIVPAFSLEVGPGGSGFSRMGKIDNVYAAAVNTNFGTVFWYRSGSSQGGCGFDAKVMCVPLAPLDTALGRQATVAEVRTWFGYGWSGQKTVTIPL